MQMRGGGGRQKRNAEGGLKQNKVLRTTGPDQRNQESKMIETRETSKGCCMGIKVNRIGVWIETFR